MLLNIPEKLQYTEQKNILIQGLPSSVEKQFAKIAFAKNVTPLLRSRKIDFALIFAVNTNQLSSILCDVLPALQEDGIFWIASPKPASKIATDLSRACSWNCVKEAGFETAEAVTLDHVWTATRFVKTAAATQKSSKKTVKKAALQEEEAMAS